jgi:hypothetical protein
MTFAPNSLIQAQDLTSIQGTLRSDQPYADASSAEDQISALWGVGFGDRGYGQSLPVLRSPLPSEPITSAQWQALLNAVSSMAAHTGTSVSGVPSFDDLNVGSVIQASGYDWSPLGALLDAVRLNVNPLVQTQVAGVQSVRVAPWTDSVSHEFWADFGSEDAARFFFNSGGAIILRPRLQDAPDTHSESWANMFLLLGEIRLRIRSTIQTGTGGTGSLIGYYDLTDTYQTIFEQFDTGTYSANYVRVRARRALFTGVHGANGSRIEFEVTFDDVFGGPGDPVQGTLTSQVLSLVSDGTVLTVGTPVYNTLLGVDGGGGTAFFYFIDTILTVVEDYNLLSRAFSAGYDPGVGNMVALYATVVVSATGVIRGLSTTFPAFVVPTMPNPLSVITLVVEPGGVIVGAGGTGGTGAPSAFFGCEAGQPGGTGGPALRLEHATLILNYGILGGGGGGGGGGGVTCPGPSNTSAGGGGGGAGFGAGGAVNQTGVTIANYGGEGQPGGLLTGGAGGVVAALLISLITAQGGDGGGIGQPGLQGQSITTAGGAGGAAGVAIQNGGFVAPGSSLGDLRGVIT